MYNEERKRRYIEIRESNVTLPFRALERMFDQTEQFEEKNGKDVCEWTTTEILDYYKYLDQYSLSSLVVINSNLNLYTNWCLTETLVPDGQNHFLEIRPNMLNSCVNKEYLNSLIITREDLIANIDTLPNYVDRYMLLAFYEGICGFMYKEMTNLRTGDIVGNDANLCSGRVVQITDKLKEVIDYASKETQYQTYGRTGRVIKMSDEEPSDIIFKMTSKVKGGNRDDELIVQIVNRRFDATKKYLGLPNKVTAKTITLSGKLDFIRRLMKMTDLPFEEAVTKYRDTINQAYTVEPIKTPGEFIRRYKEYFDRIKETEN